MTTYTGVSGTVKANSGAIVGFVEADVTLAYETGEYIEIGQDVHEPTFGKKTISGTLKKAWGIDSQTLTDWFANQSEYNIEFDIASNDQAKTVEASGAYLTGMGIEGMAAGSTDQLMLNCPFKARDWSLEEET